MEKAARLPAESGQRGSAGQVRAKALGDAGAQQTVGFVGDLTGQRLAESPERFRRDRPHLGLGRHNPQFCCIVTLKLTKPRQVWTRRRPCHERNKGDACPQLQIC